MNLDVDVFTYEYDCDGRIVEMKTNLTHGVCERWIVDSTHAWIPDPRPGGPVYQIETGGHAAQVDEVVESFVRLFTPIAGEFTVYPVHAALAALTDIDPCAWRRHECPGFCDDSRALPPS